MAGGWKLLVEVSFPIPFVLLVLLLLPTPRVIHRGVLRLVDMTLGLTFVHWFSLLHVMLVITGTAFLSTARSTYLLSAEVRELSEGSSPNVVAGLLGKKWRQERNFWISFFSFFLWCMLARLYKVLLEKATTEDKSDAFQSSMKDSGAVSAPTKPALGKATKPDMAAATKTALPEPSAPPMPVKGSGSKLD